jgi:hypothetical protein
MTGFLYQTLEGIFGTAVDVSSSLIILFTIYGAFLQQSARASSSSTGASPAMGGRDGRGTHGRARVVPARRTVRLGRGHDRHHRVGGVPDARARGLRQGRRGRPARGRRARRHHLAARPRAAAFLIAEFLKISYLDVLLMATVPTILYYLSLFLMVELDARKFGMRDVTMETALSLGELTRRYWYHFGSLVSIVVFMVMGFSPILSVFYATVVTYVASFIRRDTMMGLKKLVTALKDGSGADAERRGDLRRAGIIVGVVAKTGLGLKFSAIVIAYAGGSLPLTALYTALIVWVIGLAVPVTASYIICAVIAAPALMKLGVPDYAAHMFIFYYAGAVGGLAADRAVAVRRCRPSPAATPIARRCSRGSTRCPRSWCRSCSCSIPRGIALLLKVPPHASWGHVAWIAFTAIAASRARVRRAEVAAARLHGDRALDARRRGLLLIYPAPATDWIGLAGCAAARLAAHPARAARERPYDGRSTSSSRATASRIATRPTRRSTGCACRSSRGA